MPKPSNSDAISEILSKHIKDAHEKIQAHEPESDIGFLVLAVDVASFSLEEAGARGTCIRVSNLTDTAQLELMVGCADMIGLRHSRPAGGQH